MQIFTITLLILLEMHLMDGIDAMWSSKCQLLRYPAFHKQRLWWTHDGRKLPSLTFQMRNVFGSSQVQSQFDLAAAGEGWNQMSVSPDGQSFWIQQLCMDRIGDGFTLTESVKPFAQPLFHGIRPSSGSWCRAVHTTGSHSANTGGGVGSVVAYPIHYELQCVRQQMAEHLKVLVRMKLDQIRWVYQCLQIKTHGDGSLIQILQSQSYAFEPKESLCGGLNNFESIFWIVSLQAQELHEGTNCPFDGGFQLTSITALNKKKDICDYQTYATLESDCVWRDGTEWSFDDPQCNFFEFKQATKLKCLVTWKEAGLTFVLLRQARNDDGHTVYTMVYTEIPGQLAVNAKSYQDSKSLWISLGMNLPARLLDAMIKQDHRVLPENGFIRKVLNENHYLTMMWNEDITTYEIYLRRAFGICDDERTTCDRGCDFDARNRLFCYKTCGSDDKKCDIPQWDSCHFGSNYQGTWKLVDLQFINHGHGITTQGGLSNVVRIAGNHIRFISPTMSRTALNVTLQCVHEVSETIRDWFVVRTVNQQNGCRPRDLCLELYQSELRSNLVEKNVNTLQFRLSPSHKQGTYIKSLCDFRSAANSLKTDQPKILIKHSESSDRPSNYLSNIRQSIKCGLYQIRLTGSMVINTVLLHLVHQVSTTSGYHYPRTNTVSMHSPSVNNPVSNQWAIYQNRDTSLAQAYRLDPKLRNNAGAIRGSPRICSVQLSDFNRSFGATGEFDNRLRVETACSNPFVTQMLNTTHQCISVYNLEQVPHKNSKHKMIITYNPANKEYYCWIFEDASKRAEKSYIVYLFNTPQCRYTQNPSGMITVNEELALIRMNLTPGMCLNCHRAWNDQQVTSDALTHPTTTINNDGRANHKGISMKEDSSKPRPKMRSLRERNQNGANLAVSIKSTGQNAMFILMWICLCKQFARILL